MASPSWETVAHTLAASLMHHAYCGDHGEELDPKNCPSCEAITAYRTYWVKCEQAGRIPMAISSVNNVPLFSLEEVLQQSRSRRGGH